MTTTKRRMIDPTMTSGLRRAFTAELRRQFSGLKLDIVRYFEGEDFQRGLSFNTPSVDYFSSWLQSRLQERLTGPRQERLWEMLVEESFRRGAGRAYDDVVPRDFSRTKSDLDQASRAGFVRAIMGIGVQSLEIPLTANAFCPTGEGGGIDNSCPPTRSGSDSVQDPPVIDLEVYRGGGDKEGELVTYFTTRQDMAESYVDMYNDRYGAGGKLHKKSLSILSPARQDIIFSTAVSIGFDEDDITSGTPATIFDQEIHGRDKVKKLVDTLRKSGHDGAILDDIAYGKNIQDKAYIKFSNPEPKNQIPQVRLKKGQRLTALPKDGIIPLGSGMYIYTSGGASYQLKKLGNGKYLVTGARLTTNALPFFSGARRAFDSVKLLAQRAWTEFVGGVQGLANGLARTFLDGRVRDAKPQAVAREMSKQVERARIQSTTVVSDSVVRAFNEGILVAAIPLGVTEIGVAVEWRVRRNPDGSIAKNVCRACRDLEGVVLRPSEAKGLFPRHPRCQCSLVAITKASKDQKTSRGSVVSAIQRSRRRYKSAKAREWASRVKISERRPKLTKNVLVERIDRMLTGNVFCPTGPGGGVDPSCSPSAKIQKELDRVSSSFSSSPLTDAEDRMVYDWKTGNSNLLDKPEFIAAVEKGVVEKDVTVYRAGGLSSTKALEFTTRESWAKDTAEAQDRSVITIHLKKGDRALFVPLATRHHIVEVGVLLPPSTMRKYENVTNVFCPTGPGGGVDPTCSPNEITAFHGSNLPNFTMKYHAAGRGGYRYYTESEEHARKYSGDKGTLLKRKLKIEKPLDLMSTSGPEDITDVSAASILSGKGVNVEGIEFRSKAPMWRQVQADGLKQRLKEAGYDAIVISEKGHDKSYFVLEDSQIIHQ